MKIERATDLAMRGVGLSLDFTRTYRSRRSHNGRVGYNWMHNHDFRIQLEEDPDQSAPIILLIYPTGNRQEFRHDGVSYVNPTGNYSVVIYDSGAGEVRVTTREGKKFTFDARGPLLSVEDRFGNRLEYEYEMSGGDLITTEIRGVAEQENEFATILPVTSNAPLISKDYQLNRIVEFNSIGSTFGGRYFQFEYWQDADVNNPNWWKTGRIKRLSDHSGREVFYDYDTEGNLASVTSPRHRRVPVRSSHFLHLQHGL